MNIFYFIVQNTFIFAIPLLVVALGGMYSERSGVVNIALDGIMIMSAFVSILFVSRFEKVLGLYPTLFLALLIAGGVGVLFSLFHAYAAINMKADQVISGTALNMFAPAFAVFFARTLGGSQHVGFMTNFKIFEVPILSKIPLIGPILFTNTFVTTYLAIIILIITIIVMKKTVFGLRLRAAGELPQALDAAGVNVYKYRYIGVMLSGLLAGLGGFIFISTASTSFAGQVGGYGFLALTVLIFGQWNPTRIFFASIFFGFMQTLSVSYAVLPILNSLAIPEAFYKMLPFLITLIVLIFTSKNSAAPKAAGQVFDKGSR